MQLSIGHFLMHSSEGLKAEWKTKPTGKACMVSAPSSKPYRRISCHGRNYSQPYFFKRNQSSDNRSHGFGAKFLLKKLYASDFSYERKSAFRN